MKKDDISRALDGIDTEYIEEFYKTKDSLAKKRRMKRLITPLSAVLMCAAVLIGVIFIPPMFSEEVPDTADTDSDGTANTDSSDTVDTDYPVAPDAPYGSIVILGADEMTSLAVNGTAYKYTGSASGGGQGSPPAFEFQSSALVVAVKALEMLPDEYESFIEYGYSEFMVNPTSYRIYKMQIVDSLESGMTGEFLYAIPSHLEGDLTEYDTLLIAMSVKQNYVLKNCTKNEITSFGLLFFSAGNDVLGNLIAFTDGVFDESLWQYDSWLYGYQFARHYLDAPDEYSISSMLVFRGATLDDAIENYRKNLTEWQELVQSRGDYFDPSVKRYLTEFETDEAKSVLEYVKPFENGVFVCDSMISNYYRRYIGGCPTNEFVYIGSYDGTETVERSEYSFEESDLESLPDIAAYIASINLDEIAPEHTDPTGKRLRYNSAMGWYEKTADGVYAIVKITWQYTEQDSWRMLCTDEMFILLADDGARVVSREGLISLIGSNPNIYQYEYGVPMELPYE